MELTLERLQALNQKGKISDAIIEKIQSIQSEIERDHAEEEQSREQEDEMIMM